MRYHVGWGAIGEPRISIFMSKIFNSSQEPPNQIQSNLAGSIIGKWRFRFVSRGVTRWCHRGQKRGKFCKYLKIFFLRTIRALMYRKNIPRDSSLFET